MKNIIKLLNNLFISLFFDPRKLSRKWRGLPYFLRSIFQYKKNSSFSFKLELINIQPMLTDRFENAGGANGHYFFQDLWASEYIYKNKVKYVVDIGSRIDGYIAHILPFCNVIYIDIREIQSFHNNFIYKHGSILDLPFEDNSLELLSCLHVIEHIGLGRYGDSIDPEGYVKAAKELVRVLKPSGTLLISTPIGVERLCFNSHRIFDPFTIINIFDPLKLNRFHYIDDKGMSVSIETSFEQASKCTYGCGLFEFMKI